jgi:NAD(P)H-flavin reductase
MQGKENNLSRAISLPAIDEKNIEEAMYIYNYAGKYSSHIRRLAKNLGSIWRLKLLKSA